jgi:hypothetical protein
MTASNNLSLLGSTASLSFRKPRKLYSKLFAAASAVTRLKWVELGDSLAYRKAAQILMGIDRRFGAINANGVNTTGANLIPKGGGDLDQSTTVNGTTETGQYQYFITGSVLRLDTGGSSLWVQGGVSPTFTDVKVYYVNEPGAGTISLVVGGVTVATASAANASVTLGILSYTKVEGQSSVSVTVSGGASVRVLFVHMIDSNLYGVDLYTNFSISGLLLADGMSSAQGRSITQAALADIAPDFFTFEMDDNFGDGGANDAALTLLTNSLDAAAPLADKLFIGSTPRAADDAGKIISTAALKQMCASKNAAYLFFDSYYLMGSYADMDSIFGADDGVHPTPSAEAYAAEIMFDQLGLNNYNLGRMHRAVNDAGTASNLAKSSAFVNGASQDRGTDVKFETDIFGYDWTVTYGRTLTFSTRGSYGTGTIIARFSGNVGVLPNILPMTSCNFTSSATGPGASNSTSTGRNVLSFVDTAQTDGGLPISAQMFIPRKYTVATLPLPNTFSGALASVSDATVTTPNSAPIGGGTNTVLVKSVGVSGAVVWLIV